MRATGLGDRNNAQAAEMFPLKNRI